MDENITFYYASWSDKSNIKDKWWINLLFSIITLRSVYPKNKIKIICYTKPPKEIFDYSSLLDYKVIYIEQWYKNYTKKRFNTPLLSKLRDCFEMSFEEKEKVILLDSDAFIIKKFTNINWNKVGVYGTHNHNVNTGVLIFDTTKENTKEYREMFIKEVDDMLDESKVLSEYTLIAYPVDGERRIIQEETVTRNIFYKHKDFTNKVFHNIGVENNGIINIEKMNNCKHVGNLNNIHLAITPPGKIGRIIISIDFFKQKIKKFLEKINASYVIDDLVGNKVNLDINKCLVVKELKFI
jgi:hypothetical protein